MAYLSLERLRSSAILAVYLYDLQVTQALPGAFQLNDKYLTLATEKVSDRMILIVLASKRAKELARGAYPMVPVDRRHGVNHLDVALQEIAEGKLSYEVEDPA